MPTPSGIINIVAPLMNDAAQLRYTDEACLPYLNIAMRKLREIFQENDIPVTNETSAILNIPTGTTIVAFAGTVPTLPSNLIEIQNIWESDEGQNNWFGVLTRKDFIPHNIEGVQLNAFGIYAWIENELHLPSVNQDRDIKIDYIKSIFTLPITIEQVDTELGVQFVNIESYLGFATAALCSAFIGEDLTRAGALESEADDALERALNIPIKTRQNVVTRRRPFRQAWKSRGRIY